MQSSKENKLFRSEALERLSSPERLDQLMQVVSPRAWLPLTTIGCLLIIAGVWSVFGRIALTVNGQGVLIRPLSVVPFQVPSEGQILTLNIKPGDTIKRGDLIGTMDQPQLKQQLLQEGSKLGELLSQNKETSGLQKQGIALKRQNLEKQRVVLAENLHNFKAFGPILQQKSFASLKQRRISLEQSLRQSRNLLPTIRIRLNIRQDLYRQRAISQDLLLQTQQEYRETQTKATDLQAQLKDLDRQESEARAEFLKNLASIKDTNTQIQNLDVQAAQVGQQDREQSIEKSNQVQTTKRRIAQLELELATKSKIISQYNGRVLEVPIVPGQTVSAGTRIAAIATENPDAPLTSVIYLADKDGKQIKPGMHVQITPSMVKRERYGGIVGTVKNITPFLVTNQEMSAVIGNENVANSIVQSFASGGGATVQIFAELQTDPNTDTGYKWSSSKGPRQLKISSGTTAQVKVKIGEQAPISYVIPIFKSLTGVY